MANGYGSHNVPKIDFLSVKEARAPLQARIKELEREVAQQMAELQGAHGDIEKLEKENVVWQVSHDTHDCRESLAVELELLKRERDELQRKGELLCEQNGHLLIERAEANSLLRKLEWCIEFKERYWCHICDRPHDKGHASDCQLAAHLKKGDTDGE